MRADIITGWMERQGYTPLTAVQLKQKIKFQERLLEVNAYLNLTAITTDEDIAVKHFIDSLSLLPWIKENAKVLDIGAGAGFPGLAVKIARPDVHMTLLDSLRKRVLFLRETVDMLQLTGIQCLHGRAEEINRKPEHGAQYDICTARAVAKLSLLVKYALPFLKPGGLFLAMKGPEVDGEIADAQTVIIKQKGNVKEVKAIEISPEISHTVVVIEKATKGGSS